MQVFATFFALENAQRHFFCYNSAVVLYDYWCLFVGCGLALYRDSLLAYANPGSWCHMLTLITCHMLTLITCRLALTTMELVAIC